MYVQHRLQENASLVADLLDQNAHFYVCGDAANMARAVGLTLCNIIADQRKLSEAEGQEVVQQLRAAGRYQEDVW